MENFINAIKTVQIQIPDDYKLVSFNVKSLFTSIPLQLALQCTKTTTQQCTVKLLLPNLRSGVPLFLRQEGTPDTIT